MLEIFTQVSRLVTPQWQSWFSTLGAITLPLVLAVFLGSFFFRGMIFLSLRGQLKFVATFAKQMSALIQQNPTLVNPFPVAVKEVLDSTFKIVFHKRTAIGRLLLLREGSLRFMKDVISQSEKLVKQAQATNLDPSWFLGVSKTAFGTNPIFNRVMGVAPMGPLTNLLNFVPGFLLAITAMGTLCVVFSLVPGLVASSTSLALAQSTHLRVMNELLGALYVAALGGGLAALLIGFNSLLAPEKRYVKLVEQFAQSLEQLHRASASVGPVAMRDAASDVSHQVSQSEESSWKQESELSAPPKSGEQNTSEATIALEEPLSHVTSGASDEETLWPAPTPEEAKATRPENKETTPLTPSWTPLETPSLADEVPAMPSMPGEISMESFPETFDADEKTQITNSQELAVDPEELRRLHLFDHPMGAEKSPLDPKDIPLKNDVTFEKNDRRQKPLPPPPKGTSSGKSEENTQAPQGMKKKKAA